MALIMTTIVKISRDPTSPCNKVIISNKSGLIQLHREMTADLEKHLKDKDVIYADASFAANKFKLLGLVKKQNW
jgi:hypothetical protein